MFAATPFGLFNLVRGAWHAKHDGEQGWYESVAEAVLETFFYDAWELLRPDVGRGDLVSNAEAFRD